MVAVILSCVVACGTFGEGTTSTSSSEDAGEDEDADANTWMTDASIAVDADAQQDGAFALDATDEDGNAPPVCDGRVEQGCDCSPAVDLCRGAGNVATYDPNAYTMFTSPAQPKANQPFDVYIVTKNRSLSEPGLLKNGAFCYGGGLITACSSAGAGCSGWKAFLFRGVTEKDGTFSFAINDPRGPTGCEGATIATLSVNVKP